jgi:outer membrane protein TolC
MRRRVFVLALFSVGISLRAADWPKRPTAVEALVAAAMAENLALKSDQLDVQIALAQLDEARSFYQPRVDLAARYTRSEGGRTIDIPAGDLVNPAYSALNQLLAAQGKAGNFPVVSNQSIPLLRGHEQETKLTLVQPLYRPEISRGVPARRAEWQSREASLAQFRRELRLQVESAYYRWLQAQSAVAILQSAAEVTAEALRANRSLFAVDKVTEDRVLRAEADDLEVQQQRLEAERDLNLSRSYLNFLLNRPLQNPIMAGANEEREHFISAVLQLHEPAGVSVEGREELVALEKAVEAAGFAESAERAKNYPTLALVAEGGIQGERYSTGHGFDYGMASLVAQLNLWDGHERSTQLQQRRLAKNKLQTQLAQVRQQLSLEAQRALDDFRAAAASCRTAERRREASARAFSIVGRREQAGMANQLVFLDARSETTRAELNMEITRLRLLLAFASLDRAVAASPLP